ncbi:unnamed protein product [Vitrella brassicaformis CCMP3155]|uniref:Proteasome subunit beta n=2 Tax=Vitrella brassicaformis TaxID=1169539 RepID=A0A0G4GRG0_VITBC|nr:unnamed protein product [Vitrella brassicaformis CCMP3155]|mmetsp:Transcript_12236/g.29305  ORF Transcript_12236/g.29305 Transcript_12236/m.29305 type:complete len:195 (+) Transcript_12236:121-705(+)|eukprot:CEM33112.1 unnamed protein product [Vitrella brassicaformis CCMP3155]
MDSALGLRGKDFVLLATDGHAEFSVLRLKDDEDKIITIDKNKLMAAGGPSADRTMFCEYIQKNIHLYRLRNGVTLSVRAAANFTRGELAYYLRRNPYQVNVLLAGHDEEGPSLYWMDYIASMAKVSRGAHGYAAYFVMSILDRHWKPDMTEEEAIEVAKLCFDELKRRFLISQSSFVVKIVDKDGVRTLPRFAI